MKDQVFLDTSIQVDRIWADASRRESITQILDKFQSKKSSSYVKMEFKRGFLQNIVYFYNILVKAKDFRAIFVKAKKLSPLQFRKMCSLSTALASFFEGSALSVSRTYDGPISDELYSQLESFLRQRIETATTFFEDSLDSITDQTGCFLASKEPIMKGEIFDNVHPRCKKQDIRCGIVSFLIQNKEAFQRVLEVLEATPDLDQEMQKMKNAVEKVLKYHDEIANRTNCWHCGDAIIAIECPSEAKLFTTNKKHFQLLCNAMNKIVISP